MSTYTAMQASRMVDRILLAKQGSDECREADAQFDAGEFSEHAHAVADDNQERTAFALVSAKTGVSVRDIQDAMYESINRCFDHCSAKGINPYPFL